MTGDAGLFSKRSALIYGLSSRLEKADRIGASVLVLVDHGDDEALAEELVAELAETIGLTDPRVADAMQLLWRLGAALEEAIDDAVAAAVAPPEENPA